MSTLGSILLYGGFGVFIFLIYLNFNTSRIAKKENKRLLKEGITPPTGVEFENQIKKKKGCVYSGLVCIISCYFIINILTSGFAFVDKLLPDGPGPTVTVDGTSFIIGETKLQTLLDAGYELPQEYEGAILESYNFTPLLHLYNDNDIGVSVSVANYTENAVPFGEGFILDFYHILYTDERVEAPIMVNGVIIDDKMTVSSVKLMMKRVRLVNESAYELTYKKGKYRFGFSIDEDDADPDKSIDLVSISYEIPINFSK